MVRVEGTHAAAGAVRSIGAVESAGAAAAGEIRAIVDVVAQGNVEVRLEARMARHCDGDMRYFPVADSGILRKGDNAFLVGGHDR
jgi:hypothetical protein